MPAHAQLCLKRVYDPPTDDDGLRVLVDRLWPRGLTKDRAAIALWLKDAAPSPALRTWFGHDPDRLAAFAERYLAELAQRPESVEPVLDALADGHEVTLLYAAREPACCHATVLREFIAGQRSARAG